MSGRPNAKSEKVSYTFPAVASGEGSSLAHPSANNCHRSGVNAVVVDATRSIMYSAGRDSSVRAWSFGNHTLLKRSNSPSRPFTLPDAHETVCFHHMDYHSDWVNDLALLQDGSKLVSCGSDGKIVIAHVESLFGDPWTRILADCPQFQPPGPLNSENAMDITEQETANGGVVGKPHHTVSLPYSQLVVHTDYAKRVKCEQGSADSELMVFSVGLDGSLKMSAMRPEGGPLAILQNYNTKTSQYSLSVLRHNDGWLVATGGSDGIIRLFDSRDDKKHVAKLKGHSDVVKCLLMPNTGVNQRLVSGSADGTIRTWDLRTQKTLSSLALHEDSVWSLSECHQPGSNNLQFYSGGRDGTVYLTDIDTNKTQFLFKEDFPILSIASAADADRNSLWVSTTDPCITRWELSQVSAEEAAQHEPLILASSPGVSSAVLSMSPGLGNMLEVANQPTSPLLSTQQAISKTPKRAALIAHHILPDRHRVVTRDSSGRVQVWNVVDLVMEQDLGVVDSIDSILPALQNKRFLPSWFSAETRTGQLTIHIDPPPRCLESTFMPVEQILQIPKESDRNLESACGNALKKIFRRYTIERTEAEQSHPSQLSRSPQRSSNTNQPTQAAVRVLEALPDELDVIVTITKDNAVLLREHARNLSLDSLVPAWVWRGITEDPSKADPNGIHFFFVPLRKDAFDLKKKDNYVMRRTFHVHAMIEFLMSKFNTPQRGTHLTVGDVQVLLNDLELPKTMDLGSIKHYLWKSADPIPLFYDYPAHFGA